MTEKPMTKREYLVSKGLAKEGHGRFSNVAKEEIKKAINAGVKFAEPGVDATSDVPATAEPRFDRPEGMYVFTNPDGRVFKLLHTNVCIDCEYSFRWCSCLRGPSAWAYLDGTGARATLTEIPSARTIPEAMPAPRRKRKAKAA